MLRQKLGCARRRQIPAHTERSLAGIPSPKVSEQNHLREADGIAPATPGSQVRRLSWTPWLRASWGLGLPTREYGHREGMTNKEEQATSAARRHIIERPRLTRLLDETRATGDHARRPRRLRQDHTRPTVARRETSCLVSNDVGFCRCSRSRGWRRRGHAVSCPREEIGSSTGYVLRMTQFKSCARLRSFSRITLRVGRLKPGLLLMNTTFSHISGVRGVHSPTPRAIAFVFARDHSRQAPVGDRARAGLRRLHTRRPVKPENEF